MKIRPFALAAACAAATLTISPAVAGDSPRGSSVSYSDLDLATPAGRTELSRRFDNAAREICKVSSEGQLKGKQRYCYEATSKSLQTRVAAIIAKSEAKGG